MPGPDAEGNEPSEEAKNEVTAKIEEVNKQNEEAQRINEEITKLQQKVRIGYRPAFTDQ